ncbi:DCC1-like thiol-disulfide oxidoreductase family protein [Alicyclobacillus acidoterrestris]|uniref:DCC1-like thiol-disulfide oxidoreductase family protein n=2 Tax=Alicyclobacillus acidoterrestris TaxID=1450 RepID=A0A9E7D012_ALIAG|nr:DCC1-like thiol-disulfide oxidoreductase family protein [Alicyclobacillus acidoterrestris]UNO50796.1 DCC1-like thiol-disulfide oxidoreductase family protein [Alicyclobacillus acidoterrestris]
MNGVSMDANHDKIVLFDGVCNLCSAVVQFIIRRDALAKFRFAPLSSQVAQKLVGGRVALEADSVVFIEDGQIYTKSTAVLRILGNLRGIWSLCYVFVVVPTGLRDAVYDSIARHRYRWFGKQATCMVPTPELQSRFLVDSLQPLARRD